MLNWPLLANPVNWVIVTLMLLLFGFALRILTTEPMTKDV